MKSFNIHKKNLLIKPLSAFTIVELLIVVVVIGILAAITIVSFGGVTSQANVASITSDLDSNSTKLQLYFTQYGSYPTTLDGNNCPTAPTADTNYCLKATTGTTLTYQIQPDNTADYALYATKGSSIYKVTSSGQPFATNLASVCPVGFIVVPGSTTYSTSSFCVMKYEAKCALTSALTTGLTTPNTANGGYNDSTTNCTSANSRAVASLASGFPILNTTQTTASTYAAAVSGCSGCKLITEAEWLTIAQNVLSNPVNWSNNAVGSGFIYSGHNDFVPTTPLAASDDSNGYFGTGNTSGNQKRTLTLTNGDTIWDIAGNAAEFTSGLIGSSQQPTGTGYAWREWTAVSGGTFSINPYPSTTALSGASSWNSTNGIGQIYNNAGDTSSHPFVRGGHSAQAASSGVRALDFIYTTAATGSDVSFRATK